MDERRAASQNRVVGVLSNANLNLVISLASGRVYAMRIAREYQAICGKRTRQLGEATGGASSSESGIKH